MNLQMQDLRSCVGAELYDLKHDKVGKIEDVYLDDETGRPEWLAVSTGWFGRDVSFVPLEGVDRHGDHLESSFDKAMVKDAPHVEPDGHLSPTEEAQLYEHYHIAFDRPAGVRGEPDADRTRTSDRGTDDAMTRSEEELDIETTSRPAGTARLRKWVETEHVQTTVPVQKERARLEYEPITDDNRDRAMSGPDISEGEHEMTLHEEEVVVEKRTVPKERVRLEKDVVTDERPVEADVRKERIEAEGDADIERNR